MKKFAFVIMVLASFASTEESKADTFEDLLDACVFYVENGYPGGITQQICESNFDLPSPFTLKCIKQTVNGYKTKLDEDACELHLKNVKTFTHKNYNFVTTNID